MTDTVLQTVLSNIGVSIGMTLPDIAGVPLPPCWNHAHNIHVVPPQAVPENLRLFLASTLHNGQVEAVHSLCPRTCAEVQSAPNSPMEGKEGNIIPSRAT